MVTRKPRNNRDNKKGSKPEPKPEPKKKPPRKKAVAKRGPGRPEHEPTEETRNIVRMFAVWATQEQIAARLGVCVETLVKHYQEILKTAKMETDNLVVGCLLRNIRAGDTTAAIWYTKARMGWREGFVLEQRTLEIKAEIRDPGQYAGLPARELVRLYFEKVGGVPSGRG